MYNVHIVESNESYLCGNKETLSTTSIPIPTILINVCPTSDHSIPSMSILATLET